jgi:3-keto-5-aminohexanoate cleavage enzyme
MREGNPNVPWSAEEIGRDAAAIREAGASILHFHARAADGSPAHAVEDYAAAISAIRRNSDLLIHPTLGQITLSEPAQRIAHIVELARDPALRPELASMDMGSTNIDLYDWGAKRFRTGNQVYANATGTLELFARTIRECGVRPGLVAWGVPFLRLLDAFLDAGMIEGPAYLLLCHTGGSLLGGHPPTPAGLRAYLDCMPEGRDITWTVNCKGGNLLPVAMDAIARGGHVAIGIGDYHYREIGAPTNADLVREVVHLARLAGREVATPEETRSMLGIG